MFRYGYACSASRGLLETVYMPFADLFACLPLFGRTGGEFDSCMDERTGFRTALEMITVPTCTACYTTLVSRMATVCAGTRDMDLCYVTLKSSGDMSVFAACAGYELKHDTGTCRVSPTTHPTMRSLSKPLRESIAAAGSSPFEIMQLVADWFGSLDFASAPCASCFARFALEVGDMIVTDSTTITAGCEMWKFASAECREALTEPLTRFSTCSGWEFSNGGEQRCVEADFEATLELVTGGGAGLGWGMSPDSAIYEFLLDEPTQASPMDAIVHYWVLLLLTNDHAAPACEKCFLDLVDAIVAEQPDIDACLSGGDCSMGDAFGVFEICAGWHFQPYVVSDIGGHLKILKWRGFQN